MTQECHVRFCERLKVKFHGPTYLELNFRVIAGMEIERDREIGELGIVGNRAAHVNSPAAIHIPPILGVGAA